MGESVVSGLNVLLILYVMIKYFIIRCQSLGAEFSKYKTKVSKTEILKVIFMKTVAFIKHNPRKGNTEISTI